MTLIFAPPTEDSTTGTKRWDILLRLVREEYVPQVGTSPPTQSKTHWTNSSKTLAKPVMLYDQVLMIATPQEPSSKSEVQVDSTASFPASAIRTARSALARRARSFGRRPSLGRLLRGAVISILVQSVCVALPLRRRTVFLSVVLRTNPAGGGSVLLSPSFSDFSYFSGLFRIILRVSARSKISF